MFCKSLNSTDQLELRYGSQKSSLLYNNDRATGILHSVSVSFHIFPCLFLLCGQNYFMHVQR